MERQKKEKDKYPLLTDMDKALLTSGNPFKVFRLLMKHVSNDQAEWRRQAKAYGDEVMRK
jgi:predicted nuclease of predicted toxin-antitoxin system